MVKFKVFSRSLWYKRPKKKKKSRKPRFKTPAIPPDAIKSKPPIPSSRYRGQPGTYYTKRGQWGRGATRNLWFIESPPKNKKLTSYTKK